MDYTNSKLINYRDIGMGQHHCIDISGGHEQRRQHGEGDIHLDDSCQSVKEVGQVSCIGTGGDVTGTRGRGNKVVCGIHAALYCS